MAKVAIAKRICVVVNGVASFNRASIRVNKNGEGSARFMNDKLLA